MNITMFANIEIDPIIQFNSKCQLIIQIVSRAYSQNNSSKCKSRIFIKSITYMKYKSNESSKK